MNKLLLLLTLALSTILHSCSSNEDSTLSVVIEGENAPEMLYVMQIKNNAWARVDSTQKSANGNNYQFNFKATEPDFYLISTGGVNGFTFISDADSKQKVVFTKFPKEFSKEKSELNDGTKAIYSWIEESGAINKKAESLKASFSQQEMTQNMLIDSLNVLQQDFIAAAKSFIEKHKNSVVALSALQIINPVQEMELYKNLLENIEKTSPNSAYVSNLKTTIKKAEEQAILQKAEDEKNARLEEILGIGKPAPEIALNTPKGNIAKLSDLRGKVVLIDFWASWCKPCRAENPNVVRLYNKYNKKGFEVYSVSLDKTKNAWVNAIKADNLTWTHVSDLQFWNSAAAQLYGVNSIPATFLIDKEGNIIAKNLRGAGLEQKLEEIFG